MAKTLSRTKLPWGPRGYYEGKPSFRKTTALRKNKTKTNEGRELSGKSAFEKNKATTHQANTLLRSREPPARSGLWPAGLPRAAPRATDSRLKGKWQMAKRLKGFGECKFKGSSTTKGLKAWRIIIPYF